MSSLSVRATVAAAATAVLLAVGLTSAGAQSATAAAEPGSISIDFHTSGATAGGGEYAEHRTLGAFTYGARYDAYNDNGGTTTLLMFSKPGVSARLTGYYVLGGETMRRPVDQYLYGPSGLTIGAGFNSGVTARAQLQLAGSDGSLQKISLTIRIDQQLTPSGERSSIKGTVTQS